MVEANSGVRTGQPLVELQTHSSDFKQGFMFILEILN